MSDEACGTCGDVRKVCVDGHDEFEECSVDCEVELCPTCRRIVSVEDAAIAKAVREIEREGLYVEASNSEIDRRWRIGDYNGVAFYAPTLPLALAAYRQAAGATGEVRT